MLMQMIGKLGKDQKADWPKHLQSWCMLTTPQDQPSLGTACITWCLGGDLPVHQLLFSHYCEHRKTPACQSLHCWLMWVTAWSLQGSTSCSPHLRLKGRGDTMIVRPMPFHWNQVTWSWQKQMPTKGGERWKTSGRRNHVKWKTRLLKVSLHTLWRTSRLDASWVLHQNQLLLITPIMGAPLCTGVQAEWTRCATTILEEPTQKVSENEKVPQSAKCLPLAQHQTGETPLGQVNRKLHAFSRTFSQSLLTRPRVKSSM